MSGLTSLLAHPALWRGDTLARAAVPGVPSGFAALDAELPGGGWPAGALTEILPQHEGIGELRILGPALARLAAQGRRLAWIAPPYLPYAPALAAAGIDPAQLVVVRTRAPHETLWAFAQALRARACGAVLAWPASIAYAALRRLQLAAEASRTLAVLFRPPRAIAEATPAALRLRLDTQAGALAVRILKRRGGVLGRTIALAPAPVVRPRAHRSTSHSTSRSILQEPSHVVDRIASAAPAARSICAGLGVV